MLYAKIYLDRDEDGTDLLVFEARNRKEWDLYPAGREGSHVTPRIQISNLSRHVAISPEARELFRSRLTDKGACSVIYQQGAQDFEIGGSFGTTDTGYFSFMPDSIRAVIDTKGKFADFPTVEDCIGIRHLRADARFEVYDGQVWFDPDALGHMIEADNEFLKMLDLSGPFDVNILYKKNFEKQKEYYEQKRREEGESACDAETIRETPTAFLTDAQRETVKKSYRAWLDRYDSQEWHDNGDFLYAERILPALSEEFNKSFAEIESLCEVPLSERIGK